MIQNIRGYDGKMADVWSAGERWLFTALGRSWLLACRIDLLTKLLAAAGTLPLPSSCEPLSLLGSAALPGVMLYTMPFAVCARMFGKRKPRIPLLRQA